jgi:hypothetical protein
MGVVLANVHMLGLKLKLMMLIKQLIYSLIIGVPLLSITGCTAIGFGIGALSDSNKTRNYKIASEQPPYIPKNCRFQIFLKNGQRQDGEFVKLMKQEVGEEYVEAIVWYDKPSKRHVSTRISEIDRIVTKEQRNGKWLGLLLGGVIDVFIVIAFIKLDKFFEGFSFFNSP